MATPLSEIELGVERTGQSIPRICRDAPRLRSELLFGGFAGVSLGACRTQRARGPGGPVREGRSFLSPLLSYILPGGNLDYASGGELRSDPAKPSSRTALDLHGFAWADFNTHAVHARSSNPSERSLKPTENKSATARADKPKTVNTNQRAPLCHGRASPESPSASASHRHDVPSATSDVPSATSIPNDGDGCAYGDAGGSPPLAPSASPPLL